jgi:hypothetical protein
MKRVARLMRVGSIRLGVGRGGGEEDNSIILYAYGTGRKEFDLVVVT